MEHNAFLHHEYHSLDEHMLSGEIRRLDDIIAHLHAEETIESLKQKAQEARERLFDELGQRYRIS